MKTLWLKITGWFKRAWKWLVAIVVGGVAIANFAGIPPETEEPVANIASETICESGDGTNARFFAEVENGIVLRVIVAQPEVLNTGKWGSPDRWVETCYGDKGDRKNYAGKEYTFNKTRNGFIAPKPDKDAILDEVNLKWISPLVDDGISNTASQ